jgi:hypothetical protein
MFWVLLLAAIPFALATSTGIDALWTMSEPSLLGVVLLSSPLIEVKRSAATIVATVAIAVTVLALLASPVVAYWKKRYGVENHAAYTRQLAAEVGKDWHEATARPLRFVAGNGVIAYAAIFYLDSHPLPVSLSTRVKLEWNTPEQLKKSGLAAICPAQDSGCASARARLETGLTVACRIDVVIEPHWLWFEGAPRAYAIDIVLPQ